MEKSHFHTKRKFYEGRRIEYFVPEIHTAHIHTRSQMDNQIKSISHLYKSTALQLTTAHIPCTSQAYNLKDDEM
jgi:hypothetical protein